MSIITINTQQVSGAIFPTESDAQISVGKGVKAAVTSIGYIGAGDVKSEDGSYTPSAFGRLRVLAARVKSDKGTRLVLAVDGGLHGVLFPAKDGKDYDYAGNVESGDGKTQYVLFGRVRSGKSGKFISLNSADRSEIESSDSAPATTSKSSKAAKPAPAPVTAGDEADDEDDIPF